MADSRISSASVKTSDTTRIIVLGSGFAGAYCAATLQKKAKKKNLDILVIDENNYFIFYPLLVEAGVGNLEPRHVIVPIRQFLNRKVRFRMARALRVNKAQRIVHYQMIGEEKQRTIDYDHLVLAMGSTTYLPDIPGLEEYGHPVKTLEDAVSLRDRAIQLLELANVTRDEKKKRALLHFVVVGGSYSGVEVAGEFNEFMREATCKYRNLSENDVQVTLVEHKDRLLMNIDADLADYARQKMEESGINVMLENGVAAIRPDTAVLEKGGELDTHTVVWCAGIAQNPISLGMDLKKDKRGYIICDQEGRVEGEENVWAVGDTAVNPSPDGTAYPPTAQSAVRLGPRVAKNILKVIDGKDPKPILLMDYGSLCPLGNHKAVAQILGVRISGFPAWFMWRTVYLMKMPTLARKIRIAADWTLDLFLKRDHVQLGFHRELHPGKKKVRDPEFDGVEETQG